VGFFSQKRRKRRVTGRLKQTASEEKDADQEEAPLQDFPNAK